MAWKDKILMDCEKATAVVEKKRDGKLSLSEHIGLWVHLAYCKLCKVFFEQSEVIDKSYNFYADDIDHGKKNYNLDPARKDAMSKALKEELGK